MTSSNNPLQHELNFQNSVFQPQTTLNKSETKVKNYLCDFLNPENHTYSTGWMRHKISSKRKSKDLYLFTNAAVGFFRKINFDITEISNHLFRDDRLVRAFYRREDREWISEDDINSFIQYLKVIFADNDAPIKEPEESTEFKEISLTNNITGETFAIQVPLDANVYALNEFMDKLIIDIAENTRSKLVEKINAVEFN